MKILLKSLGFMYHHQLEKNALVIECFDLPDPADIFGSSLSGLDEPVQSYLDLHSNNFLSRIRIKIRNWLEKQDSKFDVKIYFGCAGGLHRSVYVAERIKIWLEDLGHNVEVQHLDIDRHK